MSKKLIGQKEDAALKYHKYKSEGRSILAKYWQRKMEKIANIERMSAAIIKRQLALKGVKRLNTIKI